MTHDNVTDIVERIAPLLEELETGQDCAEYAYAKGKGFQAMTYCPEAFEALKELPEYITTLRKQLENAREALREYLEAEEIDDPAIRMQELSVCREQARKALSAIKGDKP